MAFNKMMVCAALLLAVCYVSSAPAEAPKETLKGSESIGYGYAVAPAYYGGWYPYSGGLYGSSLYSYGYPSYYSGYSGYGGYGGYGGVGLSHGAGYGHGYGYGYPSYW